MHERQSFMQTFNVPQLFAKDVNFLATLDNDLGIKFYNNSENVRKANVVLDQNLIVFVLEGEKVIYHASKKFSIRPYEGAFLRKGQYLMSENPLTNHQYEAIFFFFKDEVAAQHISQGNSDDAEATSLSFLKGNPLIKAYLDALKNYPSEVNSSKDGQLLRLKFAELFYLLQKSNPRLGHQLLQRNQTNEVELFKLMQTTLTENLTLEQYAFLAGTSVSTFKRRFIEQFEQSPRSWITEKRLEIAAQILSKTNASVGEIGDMVGYENTSHFIKMFRLKFGFSPQQFRLNRKE